MRGPRSSPLGAKCPWGRSYSLQLCPHAASSPRPTESPSAPRPPRDPSCVSAPHPHNIRQELAPFFCRPLISAAQTSVRPERVAWLHGGDRHAHHCLGQLTLCTWKAWVFCHYHHRPTGPPFCVPWAQAVCQLRPEMGRRELRLVRSSRGSRGLCLVLGDVWWPDALEYLGRPAFWAGVLLGPSS